MPALLKVLLLALVLPAAAYDLRFRRVPNWLSVSGVVAGFAANLILFGWPGLTAASFGLLCSLAVYVPLYLIRGMGAGDVKLMAAVGAMVGASQWLGIFLITAILGGIVALAVVAWKKRVHETLFNLAVISVELVHFRAPSACAGGLDIRDSEALRLPHAAVIASGCIAFLLFSSAT